MKRNFRDGVDPKVRRLFPWSLFFVLAFLFALLAWSEQAHSEEPKPSWTCETVRQYLTTHTEAEARAKAIEMHLPKWIVRKAEKCIP